MPYILFLHKPELTILVADPFDAKAIEKRLAQKRKPILIEAATGKHYMTQASNIALIQEVQDADFEKRLEEIKVRADAAKEAAEEDRKREERKREKLLQIRPPRMVIPAPGPGKLG